MLDLAFHLGELARALGRAAGAKTRRAATAGPLRRNGDQGVRQRILALFRSGTALCELWVCR
jgi:hypothetical protein